MSDQNVVSEADRYRNGSRSASRTEAAAFLCFTVMQQFPAWEITHSSVSHLPSVYLV